MPYPELIKHIRVVHRDIHDCEVGQSDVLKHISMDITGLLDFITAQRFKPHGLKRLINNILIYNIEINKLAIVIHFFAVGHDDKSYFSFFYTH